MKLKFLALLSLAFAFIFTGCATKETYKKASSPLVASNIASYELSHMKRDYERFLSERFSKSFQSLYKPGSSEVLTDKVIAVTSMVSVNNFNQTSNFGRLFTDLMITDLERSGWNVLDIRGKTFTSKQRDGEFYLDRTNLKKLPKNSLILVGTYTNYKNGLILNLRLLDPKHNQLISSTNLYLDDKESYNMANMNHCKDLECKEKKKKMIVKKAVKKTYVQIVKDDCTDAQNCKE